ncbi:hypothetical protein Tco_1183588 [Tanacetum coccineum]
MTNPEGPNNSQLGDMHPKILKNTQKEEDGKNLKMEALVKKFSFESDYLQWSRKGKSEGVNGQDHSTKNKWSGLTQNQWSDKAPAIVPTLKSYGESSGHNFQQATNEESFFAKEQTRLTHIQMVVSSELPASQFTLDEIDGHLVPWTNEHLLENRELNSIIGAWFTLWRD